MSGVRVKVVPPGEGGTEDARRVVIAEVCAAPLYVRRGMPEPQPGDSARADDFTLREMQGVLRRARGMKVITAEDARWDAKQLADAREALQEGGPNVQVFVLASLRKRARLRHRTAGLKDKQRAARRRERRNRRKGRRSK